jgi:hypothetical protein
MHDSYTINKTIINQNQRTALTVSLKILKQKPTFLNPPQMIIN